MTRDPVANGAVFGHAWHLNFKGAISKVTDPGPRGMWCCIGAGLALLFRQVILSNDGQNFAEDLEKLNEHSIPTSAWSVIAVYKNYLSICA